MNEREQIITFLLQACDQKNAIIAELQKNKAELEKKLAATAASVDRTTPPSKEVKPNGKPATA